MTVRDLVILGCSSQQPTRMRNHGAYLLRWNEEGFLFDPGEGTQRQFIFTNIAPPTVTRIFVSHFHGDHCLGLGSMLMRLNLDKVQHPIHCYYPASGKKYFDRLRYGTIYHENIQVVEHPISAAGVVEEDDKFKIEAAFLNHGGIDNIGWRITEANRRKYDPVLLEQKGILGPLVKRLEEQGHIQIGDRLVTLDEVSTDRKGDVFAIVLDTRPCPAATEIARGAQLLLCESTYLQAEAELAQRHHHLTTKEAAAIAVEAGVERLILTHFSARYLRSQDFEKEAREVFPNSFAADDCKIFPWPRKRVLP